MENSSNWKDLFYVATDGYRIYASWFSSYAAFIEECRAYEDGLK